MTEVADTIRHTYKGVEFDIPEDLLAIQQRYNAADAACIANERREDERETYRAAWDRRTAAVMAKHRHPWMDGGRNHAGDAALRDLAKQQRDTGVVTATVPAGG
jgi:hypothetical protein